MAILKILWPFVWEVLLGNQTVFQAIRTNKKRLLLFLMVIGMIFTTSWSMMRSVSLGRAYLDLQHQCVFRVDAKEPVQPPARSATPVATATSNSPSPASPNADSDEALKMQVLSAMRGQKTKF